MDVSNALCVIVFILISCQNLPTSNDTKEDISLSSDDGNLDLSLSTIKQQNIEKEKAKKNLAEARIKRTIIQPKLDAEIPLKPEVNIALFARQNLNAPGKKIYFRMANKKKKLDPCLRFVSQDDAQRFFLANNGPNQDFWNLDPDGDGFACKWDPTEYRKLLIKTNK